MTDQEQANLATVRRYLAALERGVTGEALAAFFTPEVVQEELPNRLVELGAVRGRSATSWPAPSVGRR